MPICHLYQAPYFFLKCHQLIFESNSYQDAGNKQGQPNSEQKVFGVWLVGVCWTLLKFLWFWEKIYGLCYLDWGHPLTLSWSFLGHLYGGNCKWTQRNLWIMKMIFWWFKIEPNHFSIFGQPQNQTSDHLVISHNL